MATGKAITREELIQYLDAEIESKAKHWGPNGYYTKRARERKEIDLQMFDAGEAVPYKIDSYQENGMDFEDIYYTDGTVRTACYGWSD